MLYSQRCLSKIFSFLLIIIFLSSLSSSLKLGISPANIELNGLINQNLCKNITIYSDKKVNLNIVDLWANLNSRKIEDYNLTFQDMELKVEYIKQISVKSENKLVFCIKANKSGSYNGALIFKSTENPAGVGIWVKSNIISKEKRFPSITGDIIQINQEKSTKETSTFPIYILLSSFVLLFVLLFFVRNLKNHRKN